MFSLSSHDIYLANISLLGFSCFAVYWFFLLYFYILIESSPAFHSRWPFLLIVPRFLGQQRKRKSKKQGTRRVHLALRTCTYTHTHTHLLEECDRSCDSVAVLQVLGPSPQLCLTVSTWRETAQRDRLVSDSGTTQQLYTKGPGALQTKIEITPRAQSCWQTAGECSDLDTEYTVQSLRRVCRSIMDAWRDAVLHVASLTTCRQRCVGGRAARLIEFSSSSRYEHARWRHRKSHVSSRWKINKNKNILKTLNCLNLQRM